jgi:N-acetylmuramoyl-L-alanine amidase
MRIGIVVGHNMGAQGAVRVTKDRKSEFVWNSEVAQALAEASPQVRVFFRPSGVGYAREVALAYAEADRWGADVTAELHFNGGPPSATGTETLYATESGRVLAERVHGPIVAAMGLRDRGLKRVEKGGNGYGALMAGKAPAVILEPYFGSNAGDCRRADERLGRYVAAILDGMGAAPVPINRPPPVVEARPAEDAAALAARLADLERRVTLLEARA